ncbi:hypothetical protein GALMADRAFT_244346 [Galerina marginata CBS 339.88]|uniref:MARVEL domain-containing protein n=1 Tax=Galerina marginata (strain CBS 339.88) TaxID=685588 RepID=A0A067TII5_GALM3|nr:hypothetical protein GALMADRAFT_244346 [Galerina marginata CBS 339.88]
MAESTPLLDDTDEVGPRIVNDNEAQANFPAEQTHAPAYFKILIVINLIVSAITLALVIANYIVIKPASFGYFYKAWNARESSKTLGIWIFVSLIFSVINVLVNFPILLNVIVDVVLSAGIIASVFGLVNVFPDSSWCRKYDPGNPRPGPFPVDPKCAHEILVVVKILTGTAVGFGAIVGLVYLVLLILRSIAIIRTNFWKKPLALTFPTGQLTLEISLKLLRQESATTQSAEASGSGHGPLYL